MMTRDDIVRMAHEAGMEQEELVFYSPYDDEYDVHIDHLERFANLVAAAEREACAKLVEEWITHPHLAIAIRAREQE